VSLFSEADLTAAAVEQHVDPFFLTLRAAAAAPARTAAFMGRQFRVVPAVLVRSQVLNNNLGRTFLPANEITDDWADAWNGIPVLVGPHPSSRGVPQSGRRPELLNERGAGWIFAARAEQGPDGTRRLAGEVWLDIGRAPAVQGLQAVLDAITAGRPVELSTGFATQPEQRPGALDGMAYDWVLHPTNADHLVISVEMTGACSVSDGCGLGVNCKGGCGCMEHQDANGEALNVMVSARNPVYQGTESTAWSAPTLADYVAGLNLGDVNSIADLSGAQKSRIANHTLLGDPAATTFSELSYFPVVNPRTHHLNEGALRAVLGGRGTQANIPPAARNSAQAKARQLLHEHYGMALSEADEDVAADRPRGFKAVLARLGEMFASSEQKPKAISFEDMAAANVARDLIAAQQMTPSDQERTQIIREALQSQFGASDRDVMVTDVYSNDKVVVFWFSTPMGARPPGAEFYRSTWTEGDNGRMTFAEPTLVRRMTTYEPVPQGAPAANAGEAEGAHVHHEEEAPMGADETKALNDLAAAVKALGEQITAVNTKVTAMEVNGVTIAGLKQHITTLTEKVDGVIALTAPAVEERERERVNLVQKLSGNHKVPFSLAELEAKPLDELRKIEQLATTNDFSGRGGPQGGGSSSETRYAPPRPYYEKDEADKK
jgi:hypothetical protein